MQRRDVLVAATGPLCGVVAGCLRGDSGGHASVRGESLSLVATTSIDDTGLLDPIRDGFTDRYGVGLDVIAQGTGAALQTGRNGDCDVVMMHARSLEDTFLRQGWGINRRVLMSSDFIVVGPDSDPAGIDDADDVVATFRAIAAAGADFISRGDNSGTHRRELEIWAATGVDPEGAWYRRAGTGMGNVLIQADEIGAYALAVRGTYLSMRSDLENIGIHVQRPLANRTDLLENRYSIAAINPARHPHVAYDLAMAFVGYITSPEGQAIIQEYTVDGEQLFAPRALSAEPSFQQYVPVGWEPAEDDDDE